MKYVLIVNFQPGVIETPMDEWKPKRSRPIWTTTGRSTENSRRAVS